jgi:glucosamine--fructose-6-phosphate aminotransferase (isomerizing)
LLTRLSPSHRHTHTHTHTHTRTQTSCHLTSLQELTYIHAEAIAAGELKHGPLALIEPAMPIILVSTLCVCVCMNVCLASLFRSACSPPLTWVQLMMRDHTFGKSQNALEQIVARGGRPIVICPKGDRPAAAGVSLRTIEVPQLVDCLQNVITVLPLQLLSYHLACLRGHDVDCPRNLAKSVTVE